MSVTDYHSNHLLLPKVSDLERRKGYIHSLGIILGPWLAAHRIGNVQRGKFQVYINIDKSLDLVCRRIVGEGGSSRTKPVLVAFGSGAQVCSSDFGYAPAPQKRSRKRLSLIHGARVTVVHEAYTSQEFCHCHGQRKSVFTTKVDKDTGENKRVEVHGVKRFVQYRNAQKNWAPHYWHHDTNAVWNILNICLALGRGEQMPPAFRSRYV